MKRLHLALLSIAAIALLTAVPPANAQCPGDVVANGVVNVTGDLTLVILDYGCTGSCTGDANGNGITGENDYLTVQSNLGPCPLVEDVNQDGTVNIADMQVVANNDGLNCLVDADNDTDVDEQDALPLALADVNGDGVLDQDDLYDTFLAMGRNCIFDVNRDGSVDGSPGGADFDQICRAAGHC